MELFYIVTSSDPSFISTQRSARGPFITGNPWKRYRVSHDLKQSVSNVIQTIDNEHNGKRPLQTSQFWCSVAINITCLSCLVYLLGRYLVKNRIRRGWSILVLKESIVVVWIAFDCPYVDCERLLHVHN